jgi:hypothetical protein
MIFAHKYSKSSGFEPGLGIEVSGFGLKYFPHHNSG